MAAMGRVLIVVGLGIALLGVFFLVGGRIPWLGRLPGDVSVERPGFSFYFPITTCIVVSLLLSWLFGGFRK